MRVRCPACGYLLEGEDFPRLMGVRAICPQCRSAMELPATTIPFSDRAAGTVETGSGAGGSLSPENRYAIVVADGRQRGRVFSIERPHVTIGRIGCDINLDDSQVSRQHAMVTVHGSEATLEDLGSTNGTYVGEDRIQRATLDDRSEFRIGGHVLMFVVARRQSETGDG